MKPISFGQETIYARELPYSEYEEFAAMLDNSVTDPAAWRDRQINMMVRYAVREDGTRRFHDRAELNGLSGKTVLKAVYSFATVFLDLNGISTDEIEEARKN